MKPPEDRCECRGQCGRHGKRCLTLFGQAHLYDDAVDEPMHSKYGKGRRLCGACAPTYDPYRASRERRLQEAASEVGQQDGTGLLSWWHGKRRRQ